MSQWFCTLWVLLHVGGRCEGTYQTPEWNLRLRDNFVTVPSVTPTFSTNSRSVTSQSTTQTPVALNISNTLTSASNSAFDSYKSIPFSTSTPVPVLPDPTSNFYNVEASGLKRNKSSVVTGLRAQPKNLQFTGGLVEASSKSNVSRKTIGNDDSIGLPFGSSSPNATIAHSVLSDGSSVAANSTSSSTEICSATYPTDYPVSYSTPELCFSMFFADDDPSYFYNYADRCLGGWCKTQKWAMPESGSISTTTRIYYSGIYGTGSWEGVITAYSFSTLTYTISSAPSLLATTLSPCCGRCVFTAETIGLFYWPHETAEAHPSVTGQPSGAVISMTTLPAQVEGTYINEDGFTFVSPSIYLAFTTLYGSNMCGIVGTPLSQTTVGFDPDQISTYNAETVNSVCSVKGPEGDDYFVTDFQLPPPVPITISDVAQNCSTLPLYYYLSEHPYNQDIVSVGEDPCHPIIHIPDKIRGLQPEWGDCIAGYKKGFFDPPRTLRQGTVLVPTTAQPGPAISTIAPPTPSGTWGSPRATDSQNPSSTPSLAVPEPNQPPPLPPVPGLPQIGPASPNQNLGNPKSPVRETSSTHVAGNPSSVTVIIIATEFLLDPGSPFVAGGKTSTLPWGIITVAGGTTLSANMRQIGGETTILPNGEVAVLGGVPFVIVPPRTSRKIAEEQITEDAHSTRQQIIATFGSRTVTANELTQFVLDGQTLRLDGPAITLDGRTFIMTTNALGFTEVLAVSTPVPSKLANLNVITLGDTTLSPNSRNEFIVGTETLNISASFLIMNGTTFEKTTDDRGRTIFIAISTSYTGQATTTSTDLATSVRSDQPSFISTTERPKSQSSRAKLRWDLMLSLALFLSGQEVLLHRT